jgi:hypothetical protein
MFNIQVVFHDGTSQTFVQERPLASFDHQYLFDPKTTTNNVNGYYAVVIPFTSVRIIFITELLTIVPPVPDADISSAPVEQHHAPDVEGREPDL